MACVGAILPLAFAFSASYFNAPIIHTWGWPLLVPAADPIICARSNEADENGARIHSIIGRHRHCSCGG